METTENRTLTPFQIVQKLIGDIRPIGESNTDYERLENMKQMCKLAEEILYEIDIVSTGYPFNKGYSIRRNCDYGIKFLNKIKFRNDQ